MPSVYFADEEVMSIVNHFNDAGDLSFDDTICSGLKKMAESVAGLELELVKCNDCQEYFSPNANGNLCPNCGEEFGLHINDNVLLPYPTGSDGWIYGSQGVVTGLEDVSGKPYAIVLCEYDAAWFVEASRLERI